MNPWITMFKKDFRMSKPSLVILFGLIILWLLLSVSTQATWRGSAFLLGSMGMLVWPLIFYYPVHVFRSFRQEWHRTSHLWLHTPISGWSLLSSKMAVGLSYFAAYLLVMYGFLSWFIYFGIQHMKLPKEWNVPPFALKSVLPDISLIVALVFLGILFAGIYMGLWAALISVSMQVVKNRWSKLARLLGIGIFLIPTWGFSELYRIDFFRNLLNLGAFKFHFLIHGFTYIDFDNDGKTVSTHGSEAYLPFHAGGIVFYFVISAILFYLTGWLLEKKVEV